MGGVQAFQVKIMDWNTLFEQEKDKPYMKSILAALEKERQSYTIYPEKDNVFRTFKDVPFNKVKVVILGQDPYIGLNQANGRAFAVNKGVTVPPSLKNIFKEVKSEYGAVFADETLDYWTEQGVFLLNSILTVRAGQSASHRYLGWDIFTDRVIKVLAEDPTPKVFMLWGNYAKKREYLIKETNHLILKAAHPSPLSANRGFFGCNHFIGANSYLKEHNLCDIFW